MNAIVEPRAAPIGSALMELGQHIEAIEEAYEFMLAYAAQGRRNEHGARAPGVRHFLRRLDAALEQLPDCAARACLERAAGNDYTGILEVLADDARKARTFIRFVLGCEVIGSQLVDNLNANTHLRALLTDVFVFDEGMKVAAREAGSPGDA
jgi:hypothetical protein